MDDKIKKFIKQTKAIQKKSNKIQSEFMDEVIRPLIMSKDYDTLNELFIKIPECYNKFHIYDILSRENKLKIDNQEDK